MYAEGTSWRSVWGVWGSSVEERYRLKTSAMNHSSGTLYKSIRQLVRPRKISFKPLSQGLFVVYHYHSRIYACFLRDVAYRGTGVLTLFILWLFWLSASWMDSQSSDKHVPPSLVPSRDFRVKMLMEPHHVDVHGQSDGFIYIFNRTTGLNDQ